MDFDRSAFKDEFVGAGMWAPIRVTSTDSPAVVTDTHAGFKSPDNVRLGGSLSRDYEIEYVATDLPDLAEDQRVDFLDEDGDEISGQAYRVRQAPSVTDNPGDDQSGYFLRALLTKL